MLNFGNHLLHKSENVWLKVLFITTSASGLKLSFTASALNAQASLSIEQNTVEHIRTLMTLLRIGTYS